MIKHQELIQTRTSNLIDHFWRATDERLRRIEGVGGRDGRDGWERKEQLFMDGGYITWAGLSGSAHACHTRSWGIPVRLSSFNTSAPKLLTCLLLEALNWTGVMSGFPQESSKSSILKTQKCRLAEVLQFTCDFEKDGNGLPRSHCWPVPRIFRM